MRQMQNINKSFLLLCCVGLCAFMSYNLVRMPALAPYAESLGAGPVRVGMIVAASTFTGVLLKLPLGALSDIVNRQRLMLGGVLAFAFPPFAYPLVSDLEILMALRVIHGLATAVFTPLALASVASMFPYHRGASLGWYTSAAQAGALVGPMLGGWMLDFMGFAPTFLAGGGFGLLAFGFYLIMLWVHPKDPSPRTRRQVSERAGHLWQGLKIVTRHTQMVATSMAEAAKMMANGTLMAFLPLYALSIGLTLSESGILFGIQGLTSFLSKPVMGRISDQCGRGPLITLGLFVCGLMLIGIPHAIEFWSLIGYAAGFGLGEALITSSSAALIADLAEPENVGAGMGLRGTIMDVGHACGPILAGALVSLIGYTGAFTCIAALLFLTAGGFWMTILRDSTMHPLRQS